MNNAGWLAAAVAFTGGGIALRFIQLDHNRLVLIVWALYCTVVLLHLAGLICSIAAIRRFAGNALFLLLPVSLLGVNARMVAWIETQQKKAKAASG